MICTLLSFRIQLKILNPCEHRAPIVALAYLKSFKNGKKRYRRIVYYFNEFSEMKSFNNEIVIMKKQTFDGFQQKTKNKPSETRSN